MNAETMGTSKYDRIIIQVFDQYYQPKARSVRFSNDDLKRAAVNLRLAVDNYWDLVYTYRSRRLLPESIQQRGNWFIEVLGGGKYAFVRSQSPPHIGIPDDLEQIKLPDSTPEVIYRYCGSDEQALLAKIRYCRLIDAFTGLAAWHLQGHFKTTLSSGEQVEIDELYLGVNSSGVWHVVPVEAKGSGARDLLARTQIAAMSRFAKERFSQMPCRPMAAKQRADGSILLIELTSNTQPDRIKVKIYRQYLLTREKRG